MQNNSRRSFLKNTALLTSLPMLTSSTCSTKTTQLQQVKDGKVKVPTGAGLGIKIDQAYIDKHEVVEG
ncbi:MAG: hypothetical protein AAGG68_26690 [Bacteroidota bacterium]